MNLTRWKSPPDRGEEVLNYRYSQLKSKTTGIRLAQILPGTGNKGIAISLVDSFVTGGHLPYYALSYAWGGTNRAKNITCNDRRLAVTQTLLEALKRFRHPYETVTLWIDQICICQDWDKERSQQVQMMGKIFKSAQKVVVWLGDDADDSRAGIQLARHLLALAPAINSTGISIGDTEAFGLPKRGHRRWQALAAVLRRPWFGRTWVIQEVVLNPIVELVLGQNMLTWQELETVVTVLDSPMPQLWRVDEAVTAMELNFSRINRIKLRHQRQILSPLEVPKSFPTALEQIPPFASPSEDSLHDEEEPELFDLLMLARGFDATDPRDKIYAFLGLAKHDIDPDYSLSPERVFIDFALQTVGAVTACRSAQNESLSTRQKEVRRAMILLSCAGRQHQALALPSWVPDWTVDLKCCPLIFGAEHRFQAGGSRLEVFDRSSTIGLHLCGKLFDTVRVTGERLLDVQRPGSPEPRQDYGSAIKEWWQETNQVLTETKLQYPTGGSIHGALRDMRSTLLLCQHGYYIGGKTFSRRRSLLEDSLDDLDDSHSAIQTLSRGATRGRVMFASAGGYIGLAPHGSREGDIIFVILGADVPFVLRPFEDVYEIIGEAYVQGIMNGEALAMEDLPVQDILLR